MHSLQFLPRPCGPLTLLRRVAFGLTLLLIVAAPVGRAGAQRAPAPPVEVDRAGVLRWSATQREVSLFGVNYAAPFAYDYRAIRRLGLDPKRAIEQDVAHLARLGLDAFRIHVWDREVSDRAGNLLANDHLDLLDYLLAQLDARGIKVILTPIGWWGPGYPEPDAPSPGFSNGYSKEQMSVDTVSRRAQVRYVAQFIAHVNPYSRQSYRDDPNIIAIEIFNEPWHAGTPQETTRYINTMVRSLRGAGLRKPIFYNVSEHYFTEHGHAVCSADIQGVSAQWYPTGLVRGGALPGNPLPNVDQYPLPWASFRECRNKALMVYEFDGADVAVPVMYPAMARAFRGAGFQWATQFAYDPLAIAHTNTEYQTHFLNLVYTPAKAISFLIAGEVFRQIPRGFDAGTYPASERFGAFRTSYAERLTELVSDTLFAYTGNTRTAPPSVAALRHIAGVGHSPVASYDGTGAYFLDRLADGVWRLEVYPDAVPIEDPFSRGNLRRTVTRVYWRTHDIRLTLPDLGVGFRATPLNDGNAHRPGVHGAVALVRPGVYLLTRAGVSSEGYTADRRIGGRALGEFYAPASHDGPTIVRHEAPSSLVVGTPFDLMVSVVQAAAPDSVLAFVRYAGWTGFRRPLRLSSTGAYTYRASLPTDSVRTGPLEYVVTVFSGDSAVTYPGATIGTPSEWDYSGAGYWTTQMEPRGADVVLFDAARDRSRVVNPGWMDGVRWRAEFVAGDGAESQAWSVGVDAFGRQATHVAFRTMLSDPLRARLVSAPETAHETAHETANETAPAGAVLRVRIRASGTTRVPLEVALILADGTAWGTAIAVGNSWEDVLIPIDRLRQTPLVLLPRPFPGFLPYDLTAGTAATAPNLRAIDGIQWGFRRENDGAAPRVDIASVQLHLPSAR